MRKKCHKCIINFWKLEKLIQINKGIVISMKIQVNKSVDHLAQIILKEKRILFGHNVCRHIKTVQKSLMSI